MSFGSPAGAWALLGLLAVVAIHLLQRRRRRVVATTLFLVDPLAVEGLRGRRLERLRRSLSLWLQLATVLAATVLLMRPQTAFELSRLRCVLVLDSSASMEAFHEKARAAAAARLKSVEAARVDWVVSESSVRRAPLYAGADRQRALEAVRGWRPRLATHDPLPALDAARELAGDGGRVIFVTDHDGPAVPGVERVAVGAPTDNVGFVGALVDSQRGETAWTALVRNHGRSPASRTLRLEGASAPVASLALGPGEVRTLSGPFPSGTDVIVLALEHDALPLDDRLPLVRPRPKRLRVAVDAAAGDLPFLRRFLASVDGVAPVSPPAEADLAIVRALPHRRVPALVLLPAPDRPGGPPRPVLASPHPLTDELDWSALIVGPAGETGPAPGDELLLSSGDRPVAWLHDEHGAPQLVLAFALTRSNAERVPAFVLMLHRFVERVRSETLGHERVNVETGQALTVAGDPEQGGLRLESSEGAATVAAAMLRAPDDPGFFRVWQGDREALTGAAHFADAAEADLTQAASREDPVPAPSAATLRRVGEAPWTPLLVLLLGALIAADGALRGPRV